MRFRRRENSFVEEILGGARVFISQGRNELVRE